VGVCVCDGFPLWMSINSLQQQLAGSRWQVTHNLKQPGVVHKALSWPNHLVRQQLCYYLNTNTRTRCWKSNNTATKTETSWFLDLKFLFFYSFIYLFNFLNYFFLFIIIIIIFSLFSLGETMTGLLLKHQHQDWMLKE
jgi:hypothetical protein